MVKKRWRAVLFATLITLLGMFVAYNNGDGITAPEWIGVAFTGVGALLGGEAFIAWLKQKPPAPAGEGG